MPFSLQIYHQRGQEDGGIGRVSKYQLIQLSSHTQTLCMLLGELETFFFFFLGWGKVNALFFPSLFTIHYLSAAPHS